MIKVKDNSGNVVNGVLRDSNGSLIVNDTTAYTRYKAEVELRLEVKRLRVELDEIKKLILNKLEH
jgi:hypothetical protein